MVRGAWDRRHRYSPMQSGLLTRPVRRRARGRPGADDDWRRRAPEFRPPRLERNLALRDALRPIARRHGTTVSAVAVAWTLAWPGVTGAIVGARSARQVEGWIAAAALDLTPSDLDEIAAAHRAHGGRLRASPAGGGRSLAGTRRRIDSHRRAPGCGGCPLATKLYGPHFPFMARLSHRALRVAGAVVAYRLYDVGYALDLERAARLVEGQATGRLRPTRGEAKALVIAQPPLTLALGPVALRPGYGGPLARAERMLLRFRGDIAPAPRGAWPMRRWAELVASCAARAHRSRARCSAPRSPR